MKRARLVTILSVLVATVLMPALCGSDEEDWTGLPLERLAAIDAAQELGDAVVSYLNGRLNLEAVEGLVAPSAREDLAQMLSSLDHPKSPTVQEVVGRVSSSRRQAVLRFVEAEAQQPVKVTVTVDRDRREQR